MKEKHPTFQSTINFMGVLLCVLLFSVGCQRRATMGTSGFRTPQGSNQSNNTSGQTLTDPQVNDSNFDPGASAELNDPALRRCYQLTQISFSITEPCGPAISEFSEELSRECVNGFNQMYNIGCNGLESRLRGGLQACARDVSQFWSFLPASCQSVLRQYYE